MIQPLKHDFRVVKAPAAVAAMALLVELCGQVSAQAAESLSALGTQAAFASLQGPTTGQSVITSRGPAFVTGQLGSMNTTSLPGGGGQGFHMNDGNGTSTLIVPGGVPQTVATPR
jgi:hypothetical protein